MNKKFAPIFITVIICLFLVFMIYAISYHTLISGILFVQIFGGIYTIGVIWVIIALIVNLIKRLKEIKEEKEDDLSQY